MTKLLPVLDSAQRQQKTGVLSTTAQPMSYPISPYPTTNVMLPNSEPGKTGTIKLTGAVKVVQVPVAGQPGRYVTGLLPLASSTSPLQQPGQSEEEPFSAIRSTLKNFELKTLKRCQKLTALALLLVLALAG